MCACAFVCVLCICMCVYMRSYWVWVCACNNRKLTGARNCRRRRTRRRIVEYMESVVMQMEMNTDCNNVCQCIPYSIRAHGLQRGRRCLKTRMNCRVALSCQYANVIGICRFGSIRAPTWLCHIYMNMYMDMYMHMHMHMYTYMQSYRNKPKTCFVYFA